jgi:hypothetical protein
MIVLFLLVGYLIGVWMPGPGQRFKMAIGM